MTEDDIAAATGLPVHTWRRRHGAAFRTRTPKRWRPAALTFPILPIRRRWG
ncbi:hypothetical protein ABZ609_31400 [Streptomyces rubiginosohelvolus]|uniref:hypothetical protein n=1 Tax=Streptomyces rubiginosohelvolus TaxID=67362 RepID=UPI0033C0FA10